MDRIRGKRALRQADGLICGQILLAPACWVIRQKQVYVLRQVWPARKCDPQHQQKYGTDARQYEMPAANRARPADLPLEEPHRDKR
jgi:hypothetical protein